MKNLLAAVTVAFAPLLAPALAADDTNEAGEDEKEPTMSDLDDLEGKIDALTTAVNTTVVGILSDKLGNANSAPNCSATHTSTGSFSVRHRFPRDVTFTTDRPLGSYRGAVKITRLK